MKTIKEQTIWLQDRERFVRVTPVRVTPVRACMCARASACLIEFTDADTQKRQPGTRLRCLLTALSDGPCVTKPFLGLL